jgi:hypothetical protein
MLRFREIVAFFWILSIGVLVRADVTVAYSLKGSDGSTQEFRVYASGQKMRVVSSFPHHGSTLTMELFKDFATKTQYVLQDGEYQKTSLNPIEDAIAKQRSARQLWGNDEEERARIARHGTVTHFLDVRDTGERRLILEFVANHLIIKSHSETSAEACSPPVSIETTIDGWYIDPPAGAETLAEELPYWLDSRTSATTQENNDAPDLFGCSDKHVFKVTGERRVGMPLAARESKRAADGAVTTDFLMAQFSAAPLKPDLFSLPDKATPQQEEIGTKRLTSENVKYYREWVPADMRVCFGPVDTTRADREINTGKMLSLFATRLRDLGFVPVELNSREPEMATREAQQQHCECRLELRIGLDGVPDDENDSRPPYDDSGWVPYSAFDSSGKRLPIYISGGIGKTIAASFEAVADSFMMKLAEYNRSIQKRRK